MSKDEIEKGLNAHIGHEFQIYTSNWFEGMVDKLRTLEAERALLLDVLRAAHGVVEDADNIPGDKTSDLLCDPIVMGRLLKSIRACSHIEIGEKG